MTQLTRQRDAIILGGDSADLGARSTGWALVADIAQLCKMRITVMVAVTAYIGFAMAVGSNDAQALVGRSQPLVLTMALLGTALSCMGACALNQLWERDTDALMKRTEDRPLPAGRVSPLLALTVGAGMSSLGVMLLLAFTTGLAAAIAASTIFSYVLVYTPMKRLNSLSTIVGAGPGAAPPLIGYAAASGHVGRAGLLLFAIMFLWQLPHFLAIAWLYRKQYARAGLLVLPVVDDEMGSSTFRQILLGSLALLPLGLLPAMLGISGPIYFYAALAAGVGFLAFAVALVIGRSDRLARALFFASLVYLPLVFTLMLVDQL